jgi:hypothetical protein
LNSAEVKFLKINFNEVLEELRKYALVMGKRHGTKAILLTGSLAKGTYTGTSDADLLIVADNIPHRSLDRYALFADDSLSIDIEPRVFTTEEFLKMIEERNHFAVESVKRGIPLFGEAFILKSRYRLV